AFALGFFVSPGLKTVLWTLSLGFMGTICLLNASRCGRIHCYFTGPFFILAAVTSLGYGSGLLPFGPSGWKWIGNITIIGAIAFTHFHWDHIQGFPFFAQAYDAGQKITLLTLGRDQTVSDLREIFEVQMQAEYFPVQLDHMGANFEFLQIADASKHFTGINN